MTTAAGRSVALGEAVPLAAAWAARLARESGIRLLLIKGRPATDLGVRADRPSGDVDVWVDPRRRADYLALLGDHGWRRASGAPDGVGWGHATTMTHDGWICTIDVHHAFPGFLTADQTAFDHVWSTRGDAHVGGHAVAAPDVVTSAAVSVLHGIRSSWNIPETHDDVRAALGRAAEFTDAERRRLEELVRATRSTITLQPLLEAAAADVAAVQPDPELLAEWRARSTIKGQATISWVLALRKASWRRRPEVLRAAMRPTASDYAAVLPRGKRARALRAVAHRVRRGACGLPAALRMVLVIEAGPVATPGSGARAGRNDSGRASIPATKR